MLPVDPLALALFFTVLSVAAAVLSRRAPVLAGLSVATAGVACAVVAYVLGPDTVFLALSAAGAAVLAASARRHRM